MATGPSKQQSNWPITQKRYRKGGRFANDLQLPGPENRLASSPGGSAPYFISSI